MRLRCLLPMIALGAPALAAAPVPAEDLFRSAPLEDASLSPDGRHLGAILPGPDDRKNLVVFDLKDYRPEGLRAYRDFEISSFRWLGNDRVVFNVLRNKIYSWGLYGADLGNLEHFSPIDRYDQLEIVGIPADRPGTVVAWIRQSSHDGGRPGDLVDMNAIRSLRTAEEASNGGAVTHVYEAPRQGPAVGWMADRSGELALCFTWMHAGLHTYRYDRGRRSWREVVPPAGVTRILAVDFDPGFAWVATYRPPEGFALRRMDLATGALEDPVATDPDYDIGAGTLHFSEASRRLAGVVYLRKQARAVWFSRSFAAAQAVVDRKRTGTDNILIDADRSERKFLFCLTGPAHPATYELLDLGAHSLNILQTEAPWLRRAALATSQPISFRARDGLALEGYLTLPEGASRAHPVPLVVLVHGGPWVRDTPDFDPQVEFLASRGYAVLRPEYRGSLGYRPEVSRVPAFDYGKMGDDVTDATRWALGGGLIDPGRVAIMGGSFGGYLAVSGVTSEPDLYRCAVTVCGVFDWGRFIRSKRDVARPGEYEMITDGLGRPGTDDSRLEGISPLDHADRIRAPILIAHGVDDRIVDVAQSRRLASELKRRGIPHETFFRAVEGHGFADYGDRVAFYHRVEAFLARYLGGASLAGGK